MDNKAIFSQAILLIRGRFCQSMIARSLKETYLTAYHSEACFFSLPGAIERSLYEQHQSVGGDFYNFKVHRDEVFKACYAVLKNKKFILTKEIFCRDYANNVPFPGRILPKHTPLGVLVIFLIQCSWKIDLIFSKRYCLILMIERIRMPVALLVFYPKPTKSSGLEVIQCLLYRFTPNAVRKVKINEHRKKEKRPDVHRWQDPP